MSSTVGCYGFYDGFGVRDDKGWLFVWGGGVAEGKEPRGTKFVDVGPVAGVKVEGNSVALFVGGF